ncbi:ChaN family lipoprotein [Pararhizobium sp.]|uniref:ChaN family lipoprotein n=1 Tax=Pararhizobium sp. TaxID=1977563 RepID=UPI00271A31ED|nr:ChaN family lipoprotein [Pararhizobium sp.]MDO9415815.1 ChaN family lipoprotein [Pararhizobium sp.]
MLAACCVVPDVSSAAAPGQYSDCGGSVTSASTGESLAFAALAERLKKADIVLFGEVHGVREHAAASACVLSMLADNGRPTGLVMEIFSTGGQTAIDRYRNDNPEDAAGLGVALEWWKRGWPAFDHWFALLDRAFALKVDIAGGDMGDGDRLDPDQRLGANLAAVRSSWTAAMEQAHCGLLDRQEAARLGDQQIQRDLSMAQRALTLRARLSDTWKASAAVLVHAGRGHVRKDRSLFKALGQEADASVSPKIISIGAFGAEDEQATRDSRVFDYIWTAVEPVVGQSGCSLVQVGKAVPGRGRVQ